MLNFEFLSPTKIFFGRGVENQVGDLLKQYGATKVLLHYGGGSVKRTGLFDRVVDSLKAAGVEFVELGGVKPNPRLSLVYEGIKLCKETGVDFLLAVGGGSVIDSTKAIAHGLQYDGDVWDFFCGKATVQKSTPVATILTIPAAGSEGSNSCVITNENGNIKRGCSTELNRPVFSLLNPELCATLPKNQVANGASDIIAHAMERYFTNTTNVDITDRLTEGLIRTVMENAPKCYKDPSDYEPMAQLVWCSTLAHNNILGVGRVQDWASHNIEHELSGVYDIPHGAGLSIIFPAWMKYNYKHDIPRFCQFANKVFDITIDPFDMEGTALKAIDALEKWYKSLDLPTRLSEVGIGEDRLMEMANNVKKPNGDGTIGGFVKLSSEDCYNIYKLAL
ncbi:MAG: iron-containing alcohol dehydrogenase [Clostridiales bacterium]|nr:iron-containing alcohol dehydrogenase [Clostridiales bacterium]